MSLASVLQTAQSGMAAATLSVNVAGNNLANARTNGFKASRPQFASQSPRTTSGGAGELVSGAVELSNTDIARELIELELAAQQFAANAAVFRTADSLLGELIGLARRTG